MLSNPAQLSNLAFWPVQGFEDTKFGDFLGPGGGLGEMGVHARVQAGGLKVIKERSVLVSQASQDLGVHQTQLRQWVKDFESDRQHSFPGQGQMKSEPLEIERLLREVIS